VRDWLFGRWLLRANRHHEQSHNTGNKQLFHTSCSRRLRNGRLSLSIASGQQAASIRVTDLNPADM
jgi:hypothetical protein